MLSIAHHLRERIAFTVTLAAGLSASLGASLPALAQDAPELPDLSPLARVEQRVGITDFSVEYSSPGVKGREIWGGLVPYDELWRTGANAATRFEASRAFQFGATEVPAGAYALYSIPGTDPWTLILNRNADAAGTRGYDESLGAARVEVKPVEAAARERMTFLFSDSTDDGTRLDLEWAGLRVSVPITVATDEHVKASIDDTLAEAWRPHFAAARWLLRSGGDLELALTYIDTSIAIQPTWWNQWVRAEVLAGLERPEDAVAAAREAQRLGKGDRIFDDFFATRVAAAIDEWE